MVRRHESIHAFMVVPPDGCRALATQTPVVARTVAPPASRVGDPENRTHDGAALLSTRDWIGSLSSGPRDSGLGFDADWLRDRNDLCRATGCETLASVDGQRSTSRNIPKRRAPSGPAFRHLLARMGHQPRGQVPGDSRSPSDPSARYRHGDADRSPCRRDRDLEKSSGLHADGPNTDLELASF